MAYPYICNGCGYSSIIAKELYLMPDGETEYCAKCYEVRYGS
jgi:predicted SprT family Zn-dependent metalloprotease